MKNLLLYINHSKRFDREHEHIAPVQIDNTLKYFKPEDIILVTNFPYEHNGIKAQVIDGLYCDVHNKASKINVIIYLLENGLLDELTWFHDFDAFQINPFDISIEKDVGFTDYGWSSKWNTGSIFFKPSALDVFRWLKDAVYEYKTDEERALKILTKDNFKNINSRYQRLNVTYNFGSKHYDRLYEMVELPVKVLHFHPHRLGHIKELERIIPDYLIKMFHEYPSSDYRSKNLIKEIYESEKLSNLS